MPSESNTLIWLTLTLTLFSSTSLLLFPSPTNAVAATALIKQACKNTGEYKDWSTSKCIKTLESDTHISSITNLTTLATTIIKIGVANATSTKTFIQQKVSGEVGSEVNSALEACVVWYKDAIQKFNASLAIIKEDKGYDSAMLVLLMAGHDVNYCDNLLAATTIKDSSIIIANKIVIIFCSAARQVTTILSKQTKSRVID